MANPVLHAEVIGKDVQALDAFYTQIFDWKLEHFPDMGYASTGGDERPTVGLGRAQDGVSSYVTFYVGVDDVSATLDRVASLGGTVMMPETQVMDGLVIGLFADPEGHTIGLIKS